MAPRKKATRKTTKPGKVKSTPQASARNKIATLKKLIDHNEQTLTTLYPNVLITLQKQKTALLAKKKTYQANVKTAKAKVATLRMALKAKKSAAPKRNNKKAAAKAKTERDLAPQAATPALVDNTIQVGSPAPVFGIDRLY